MHGFSITPFSLCQSITFSLKHLLSTLFKTANYIPSSYAQNQNLCSLFSTLFFPFFGRIYNQITPYILILFIYLIFQTCLLLLHFLALGCLLDCQVHSRYSAIFKDLNASKQISVIIIPSERQGHFFLEESIDLRGLLSGFALFFFFFLFFGHTRWHAGS